MEKGITLEKLKMIFNKMLSDGYNSEEIIHNIFLNYSTFVDDNEIIYKHKKIISQELGTDFRNVFLIGSRHLGIKIDDEVLLEKNLTTDTDYDYAIIDLKLFSFFFDNYSCENPKYNEYLLKGYLHPLYNKPLKKNLRKILSKCEGKLSICFYISERAFIKKLNDYYGEILNSKLSEFIKPEIINRLN